MSQRIRYMKNSAGRLQSVRLFTTGTGQAVSVELDVATKKYRVTDAVSGEEVASGGNTRNLAVLKIQAKKGLSNLGVSFQAEERNRYGDDLRIGFGMGLDD